jgi:hypothetical protein
VIKGFFTVSVLAFGGLCLAGCSTVAPVPVQTTQTAFDGAHQDAGILEVRRSPDGKQIGLRVTAFYMAKLRDRVSRFGARLSPPVTLDTIMAEVNLMPDVPGRGETWFVPNSVQVIDAQLAQLERDQPK